MKSSYEFIKDYRKNEQLRLSFNKLAQKTFGLSFEKWYHQGYWGEAYIPYSILDQGQIVANASVNIMPCINDGKARNYIQIGTVMTAEEYRKQGLSRYLIESILKDYKNRADGIYLWANDSVTAFYPKFGFQEQKEYRYRKAVQNDQDQTAVKLLVNEPAQYKEFEQIISQSVVNSRLEMNNPELIMFYVVNFMGDCIYYIPGLNTHVIAELENGSLFIHQIFAPNYVNLDHVIKSFGKNITEVVLGFTPLNSDGYEVLELHNEDSTFFVLGADFAALEQGHKTFPTLSHA